jgi:hypothetical protein
MTRADARRRRARRLTFNGLSIAVLELARSSGLTALMQSVPGKPIIVNLPPDKPKSELSGLADVLLGSLGLTGVIVIAAVLLGAVMAAVLFWVRSRQP